MKTYCLEASELRGAGVAMGALLCGKCLICRTG